MKFILVFSVVAAFHTTEFYVNILARLSIGLNVVSLFFYGKGFIELGAVTFLTLTFWSTFKTAFDFLIESKQWLHPNILNCLKWSHKQATYLLFYILTMYIIQ